jgi:hypothetical protein
LLIRGIPSATTISAFPGAQSETIAPIKVVKAMIHNLTNLEPLLHHYDHEKVLVGPLLNLWPNSSFRVFNIAGKSRKIHETIGLGFFELEIDAKRRRAAIVAALEGCFGEVEIYDSQLEMAQMAHTLWANDETARFLATVSWESKPRPTRENSQNQHLADLNKITMLSDNQNNEFGDEEAGMAVLPPEVIEAGGQAQRTRACDLAQISELLYLRDLSDADTFDPGTLAESGSNLATAGNLPAAVPGSSVSKNYGLWTLSAAYFALCFVVGYLIGTAVFSSFTSMRQTANQATFSRNTAASITAGNHPSEPTGTVAHPIPTSSIGTANYEAPSLLRSQPAVEDSETNTAPSPEAQPSQDRSNQAEAAPDELLSQSPKVQGNQPDDAISLPQSSPPQTVKTQSSADKTVPASIPRASEILPTQVFASSASTQAMASHEEPPLLPGDAATPKAPEALATAPLQQASNLAIIPLPRPRPVVSAVSSDRPRRRIGPLGEGVRSPLLGLFGH